MGKKRYYIIAAVLGALVFIKLEFFTSHKVKAAGAGKDGKKPPVPVTVFVIGKGKLDDKIFANGSVVANEQAELKVEASGRIVYLNLPEGKTVKAGTLLLKVNDSELHAQQLEKVKAQLKLATETELRQRKLTQIEAVSKQEYEVALAALLALRADSLYLRTQIAETELYAPFTGVIGIRNVSLGSYITPAVTAAVIHQIDPVKIEFSLPEKYSRLFSVGDQISFKTEGIATLLSGKITVKDPQVDLTSRSVRYHAVTANPKALLFPGGFVRVELVVDKKAGQLFVPTEAILPIAKGKKLFVVKNGTAEERIVEAGIRTEDHIQVLSGLEIGDSVVVNGNVQLKNGAAVKVIQPKGASSEGKSDKKS